MLDKGLNKVRATLKVGELSEERPVDKKLRLSLRNRFDILVVSVFRTFTNFYPRVECCRRQVL